MTRTLALLRHLLLLLAAGLPGLAAAAHAQDYPPPPNGPVYDGADILSADTEAALDASLRAYWEREATAIVVATVPSLAGQTIDAYGSGLFKTWGIGSARTNRGLLVLVAPNEKGARIDVGCGLETIVTNDAAQKVMDEHMIPRFARGQFDDGVSTGVSLLIQLIDTATVPAGPVSPFCVTLMKEAA